MDDERHVGAIAVAVERVGEVGDVFRDAQLLEQLLRRVRRVAFGRARRQRHLPSELDDRGDDASEDTYECCDAVLAALGIGLNQCHVSRMGCVR